MRFLVRAMSGAMFVLTPAQLIAAQTAPPAEDREHAGPEQPEEPEAIVVTGTRTRLPVTALPLTVDVVGGKALTVYVPPFTSLTIH